jgi:hypothetical protein
MLLIRLDFEAVFQLILEHVYHEEALRTMRDIWRTANGNQEQTERFLLHLATPSQRQLKV